MTTDATTHTRWYSGTTRYQWMVLLIACLGWIFDVFEGQIFVASMKEAMPSLVPAGTSEGQISFYNNIANGAYLFGGALGGILFGMLSDRIGRKRTMSLTILFYSFFTCLSAFSQQWWHLAGLRFLVAMGVGGEWAVASSLVAEVFPTRARAYVGSIFHASSVLGTYLAIAAGAFLIGNPLVHAWAQSTGAQWLGDIVEPSTLPWRLGFALGILPALLILWVRASLQEPESWKEAQRRAIEDPAAKMGNLADLFRGPLLRITTVSVILASVGLITFWSVHIFGKDLLREAVLQQMQASAGVGTAADAELSVAQTATLKRWEMLGMFLVTSGGGLGLLSFGPLAQLAGRRRAFLFFYLGGMLVGLLVFGLMYGQPQVATAVVVLPVFGFLTLGMHAGYAVYFPELYPTRLRGTGTGFCFNGGRIIAAFPLLLIGYVQANWAWFTLPRAATLASCLFLIGAAALWFAPETKDRELPQ